MTASSHMAPPVTATDSFSAIVVRPSSGLKSGSAKIARSTGRLRARLPRLLSPS